MKLISLLLCACVLCGCSTKYLETQQYSLDNIPQKENYGKRYCVIKVVSEDITLSEEQSKEIAKEAMSILKRNASNWFADDENSVPIIVSHHSKPAPTPDSGILDIFSAMFISVPTFLTIPTVFDDCIMLHKISIIGNGGYYLKQLDYEWKLKSSEVNFISKSFFSSEFTDYKPKIHEMLSSDYADIRRICGPIIYAVQSLTPMERKLVEQNDEAWYLDAKYGNKRNNRINIKENENTEDSIILLGTSEKKYSSSLVKAQALDFNTMKGYVTVLLSDFTDIETAQKWIHNTYLPEYCEMFGIVTSGEHSNNSNKSKIKILELKVGEDNTFRIDFELVE